MLGLVNVKIKFSLQLLLSLAALYVGAVIILLVFNWAWHLKILGIIACGFGFLKNYQTQIRRHVPRAIIAVWPNSVEPELWNLVERRGVIFQAQLLGDSLVTQFLIILNFKKSRWKYFSVVICRDAVGNEVFRRLQVHLRKSQDLIS